MPTTSRPDAIRKGNVDVVAKDYATSPNVFFGDRPLDDPGYSAFKLEGDVGVGKANDTLDVYRVEQRLKYLGYPAFDTGTATTLQPFTVDGSFGKEEQHALKLFEKVVHYQGSDSDRDRFSTSETGANGDVETATDPTHPTDLDWLNAYNAPHWMQFFPVSTSGKGGLYASSNPGLPGWISTQTGSRTYAYPSTHKGQSLGDKLVNVELFGPSWVYDLMVAKQFAPSAWAQPQLNFYGTVDANYQVTPILHKTHDLGMAMPYVSTYDPTVILGFYL